MTELIDHHRRLLFGGTAVAIAAAQFGIAVGAHAQSGGPVGAHAALPPLKQVQAGVLDIGYAEAGPADGPIVILLHGWPYDIHSFADVAPILAAAGYRVLIPYLRGYGTTRFLTDATVRNGQQSALAVDIVAFMDALAIQKAILAGYDWGARTADVVAALWPERCKAFVSVSGYLIGSPEANLAPLPPNAELAWWYQFYFATSRGQAGYEKYRRDFAKLIWRIASPKWDFDDATFERSAAAFNNPDHVGIVIHNYRWRLGLAQGEAKYDGLEKRLAVSPTIAVPTITLEGDANGAPHPEPASYAAKFTGRYVHRLIGGGVGHNLPQEAPHDFAQAVIDVAAFGSPARRRCSWRECHAVAPITDFRAVCSGHRGRVARRHIRLCAIRACGDGARVHRDTRTLLGRQAAHGRRRAPLRVSVDRSADSRCRATNASARCPTARFMASAC